ncbi:MAG: enoyl-CoA hydratase/isomerase family protein [Bacteroidales bacterium]|nr:enoyl-CoA hydratase/isomerase family protein [Bacteroidales bacterium]
MKLKTIEWKIDQGIGHLALNQPPANTMTRLFFDELSVLTHDIIPQSAIKALIIYGNGRHFSAGADHYDLRNRIIENLPSAYPEEFPSFLKETTRSFLFFEYLQIPSFAAIRGTCFGSAMELALFCKYRICAEGTVLGFPETSFGLMPGCGGSVKLPAIVGRAKAIELIVSGRNFSASEAYEWGIVHKIVHRRTLIEEVVNMAKAMINGQ